MRKIPKIFVLIILPLMLSAQNYLWPTNASKFLSSSFCEYRPGHYHSAIDIKTWNTEGYRIFAVDSGVVDLVRVSPFGYGKVLYLRLHDGRRAVYAHLQRFNKKLEAAMRAQQLKNERYTMSWRPKNWKVKRGEILGYTGQTGIGVPHLHFEIRDTLDRPLNPLHFYDTIKDHVKPTLKGLLLRPLQANSRVNGRFAPLELDLIKEKAGSYRLSQPVVVSGKIGLALRGFDRADKVYNRYAFYRVRLYVNDSLRFNIQYDTLNFDLTAQADVEIDYPLFSQFRRRYNKLYIEPFNELNFYDRSLGNGILDGTTDTLHFRIEASDFFGNTSTVNGMLLPAANEQLRVLWQRPQDDRLLLGLRLPRRLQGLQFSSRTPGGAWQDIQYFEIRNQQFFNGYQILDLAIRLPDRLHSELKMTAFLPQAQKTTARLDWSGQDSLSDQLTLIPRGKYLVVPASEKNTLRTLRVLDGQTDSLIFRQSGQGDLVLPPTYFDNQARRIQVLQGTRVLLDTLLHSLRLEPGTSRTLSLFGNRLQISSNANTVYDTLLFNATVDSLADKELPAPILSPLFHLDGQAQIFKRSMELAIAVDTLLFPARQVGLGRIKSNGKLSWKPAVWDSPAKRFRARAGSFGEYLLVADTTRPILKVQYPKPGSRLNKFGSVRFFMDDSLSGIGTDRNIRVELDGKYVLPEWDPEKDQVTCRPDFNVAPGRHLLVIQLRDRAGNETVKQIPFEVVPGNPTKKPGPNKKAPE